MAVFIVMPPELIAGKLRMDKVDKPMEAKS